MDENKGFLYRFGKAMRSIIGASYVYLSFAFLFALMLIKVPKENESIINIAAGSILAGLGMVLAYYFGSSKDKSDQDKVNNAIQVNDAGLPKP